MITNFPLKFYHRLHGRCSPDEGESLQAQKRSTPALIHHNQHWVITVEIIQIISSLLCSGLFSGFPAFLSVAFRALPDLDLGHLFKPYLPSLPHYAMMFHTLWPHWTNYMLLLCNIPVRLAPINHVNWKSHYSSSYTQCEWPLLPWWGQMPPLLCLQSPFLIALLWSLVCKPVCLLP